MARLNTFKIVKTVGDETEEKTVHVKAHPIDKKESVE